MILPSLVFKSLIEVARQKMAIISEATVISKPSSRGKPLALPPKPKTMFLTALSFISTTLLKVIERGSMSNVLP